MEEKEIEISLKNVAAWASKIICARSANLEQTVWSLYPHMQLLKAIETILESMAYAKQSRMVNLLELQEHQEIAQQLMVDNTLQDSALLHQDI